MERVENECVDCGLPCIGARCPYRNVHRLYCDRCEAEETLYEYEGEQLCNECLLKNFKKVEVSEKC